jgi:molecular chaperone Hsp33
MTLGAQIAWDDTVLPFQLDRSDIRGRVVRLDGLLEQVLRRHTYPQPIESLVAEVVSLTALMGQAIKLRWKLSLQVRGKGAARLIATDYYAPESDGTPARIRAYASYDPERLDLDADPFTQIGEGYIAVIIDQGPDMRRYEGLTPLAGGSLAASAETYFTQSEQLPTRFALRHGRVNGERWRAGGVMLQQLPRSAPGAHGMAGESGLTTAADILSGEQAEDWNRANFLLDTVQDDELLSADLHLTDLLLRLFHQEEPRVYDAQPVSFGCSCSEDKVRQTMSIYSARDIRHMTTPEGRVTADCQFCGAHYDLDPATLGFEAKDVR